MAIKENNHNASHPTFNSIWGQAHHHYHHPPPTYVYAHPQPSPPVSAQPWQVSHAAAVAGPVTGPVTGAHATQGPAVAHAQVAAKKALDELNNVKTLGQAAAGPPHSHHHAHGKMQKVSDLMKPHKYSLPKESTNE